jgi:hypothetical protein
MTRAMTPRQLAALFDRIGLSRAAAARALGIDERTLRRKLNGDQVIERVIELAASHLETLHSQRPQELPRLTLPPAPQIPATLGARPPAEILGPAQQSTQSATPHKAPPAPTGSLLGPPRPASPILARMAEIKTRS